MNKNCENCATFYFHYECPACVAPLHKVPVSKLGMSKLLAYARKHPELYDAAKISKIRAKLKSL